MDYIYPTLNEKTRTLAVRLRFDNSKNELRPNMFAQVTIVSSSDETLLVPREAVIRTGSSNRVVLALGQGRFRAVEITLGRSNEEFFEVLEGIEEGERVVTSAQFLLDSESSKTAGVKRLVVGHTVQEQGINSACDGSVWRIDVGMARHFGGPIQVLEISKNAVFVLTAPTN